LFVVSAPSGAGKTTLCNSLKVTPDLGYSVSCTTRQPRPGEEHGEDYYFLTREDFERKIKEHSFLEYAEVHGHFYGTPLQPVLDSIKAGKDLLLDIDVQGAQAIRNHPDEDIKGSLVDVFIMPPTPEELERRLRKRGTETEADIQRRLNDAKKEMPLWREYRYTILSESMEEDLIKFRAIMRAERYLSSRLEMRHV